jgi:prepilin-type N-terminal cleavage/methylation domain-containing protein
MTPPARRASGFTLVELMIVVAIIGILSSVAMPAFKTFTLRARQSERRLVMKTIKQSAEDFYVRYGRIEDSAGNWQPFLIGAPNPPGAPGPSKRPYNGALAGWNQLGITEQLIDGSLYYSYTWWLFDLPAAQIMFIQAQGDLDSDGRLATRQQQYELREQMYYLTFEWPAAAAGGINSEDLDLAGVPTW